MLFNIRFLKPFGVVALTVIAGVILISAPKASSPSIAVEPENGAVTIPATKLSDTTSSKGSAVKFSSAVAPKIWGQGNYAPPAITVFDQISLHGTTVMQSFAYDAVNKVWIFAQVKNASTGALTLTKISPTGQKLGYMTLTDFGHAVSIGVEPMGSTTYVYTESHSVQNSSGIGFGTKIARFAWVNSATISSTSSSVTTYQVASGAISVTPMVDAVKNRITVQYKPSATARKQWVVYPLDQFKNKIFSPIVTVQWPTELDTIPHQQGYVWLNDQTILSYHGTNYNSSNTTGNATINEVNAVTGARTRSVLVTVAPSLVYREPEGLANLNGNICTGFASGVAGARKANVFCQVAP